MGIHLRTFFASVYPLSELVSISHQHFILTGDINYRYLQWPSLTDIIIYSDLLWPREDNFFTQYVDFNSRKVAILDLVIFDEPNVTGSIDDLSA